MECSERKLMKLFNKQNKNIYIYTHVLIVLKWQKSAGFGGFGVKSSDYTDLLIYLMVLNPVPEVLRRFWT